MFWVQHNLRRMIVCTCCPYIIFWQFILIYSLYFHFNTDRPWKLKASSKIIKRRKLCHLMTSYCINQCFSMQDKFPVLREYSYSCLKYYDWYLIMLLSQFLANWTSKATDMPLYSRVLHFYIVSLHKYFRQFKCTTLNVRKQTSERI